MTSSAQQAEHATTTELPAPKAASRKRSIATSRTEQLPAVVSDSATILAVIQRAAADPGCDIEKMERLMQMHEKFVDRTASAAYNAAMVRAQQRIQPVARNALNTQTSSYYAKLEDIDRSISPVYTAEGFSLSFGTADSPMVGHVRVICDVMHADGHIKQFKVDLPLDATGIGGKTNKTGVHAHGSTYSYARRYLTMMIFNVVMGDEDDDGQAAGAPRVRTITPAQQQALVNVLSQCSPALQAQVAEDFADLSTVPVDGYDKMLASLKGKAAKYQDYLQQGAQQ